MRAMSVTVVAFTLLISAAVVLQGSASSSQGQATDASAVLSAAREALGGNDKLNAVKNFVATGRTRQLQGNSLVPIEFEIYCELPDKYVRKDEIPARESEPTSSGFNGEALIQVPPPAAPPTAPGPATVPASNTPPPAAATAPGATTPPPPGSGAVAAAVPGGRAGGPPMAPPDPRKARVNSLKQDFVRLSLGMFAASFNAYPLTFKLAGQAEAPQGTADVIEVTGPTNFTARLFIDTNTHLPLMVSWTAPATNVVFTAPGQAKPENLPPGSVVVPAPPAPAADAPKEEQAKYAKDLQALRMKTMTTTKIENRIYYADYREVGKGLKFPFRLRRAVGSETVEETNFDEFKINGRIDPRRFEALK